MLKRTFTAIAFLILSAYAFSQESEAIRLNRLSPADGLPNASVSSILQDLNGYMWFGTQGGLVRYDGYNFTLYNQDPFEENSLSHNLIQTMLLDDDGNIWIGTYDGLDHFDRITSRITHYHGSGTGAGLSNNVVTSIFRDSSGRLWAGTLNGLNLLNEDRSFTHFLTDQTIRAIAETSDGRLWIGTYTGLYELTAPGEGLTNHLDAGIMTIKKDPESDTLWIGTWNSGMIKYSPETGQSETFDLKGHNIYTLGFDSNNDIWVGSWGQGLSVFDRKNSEFTTFNTEKNPDLVHDTIYSLFSDRSGVLWIGTNGGGLNLYTDWHNRFDYFEHVKNNDKTISPGKIYSLMEDSAHNIWIGIYNGGINRIDGETGELKKYSYNQDDPRSLSNNIVNEIIQDSSGRIWIMTNNGYCLYNEETDDFSRFYNPEAPESPDQNIFYRAFEDSGGRLWLGTYISGLIVRARDDEEFTFYRNSPNADNSLSSNLIRDIIEDRCGRIWIATNNGLNLFNPETDSFRHFKHGDEGTVSSNDIRSLLEDTSGKIWAGTLGGGISILDPETGFFSYLMRHDGLLGNIIMSIVQRSPGEIWIGEQNGISVYSTESGTLSSITNRTGLLNGELSSNILISSDEKVWCGSISGITVVPVSPEDEEYFTPDVRIIELEINGRPFNSANAAGNSKKIILNHNQNNISLQLGTDDYSFISENRFTYKLAGFENEWNRVTKRNYAAYTNLPNGEYQFWVNASGGRDNWSGEKLLMEITVNPHPAVSPPAFIIYGILLIALISIMVFLYIRKKKIGIAREKEQLRINRLLEERVRLRTAEIRDARDTAEKATQAKSLFLANMSHELRTPLNGILGMLTLLKKTKPDAEQSRYLEYSQVSAENLLIMLDEILNYEKLKSGKTVLTEEQFNIRDTTEYIHSLFGDQIRRKKIIFSIDTAPDVPEKLFGDSQKLTRILNNLVSNAVKNTDTGFIKLSISGVTDEDSYRALIRVDDSGRGIPADKIDSIFNSFEQLDSSYSKKQRGVGLGLAIVRELVSLLGGTISVESTPGTGTAFTLNITFKIPRTSPSEAEPQSCDMDGTGKKARIMIAEDEAINRMYISKLLMDNGFEFETCENGLSAVEKYAGFKPDIILMDIGMPVLNGLNAVRRIREMENGRVQHRAVIIMLSAHVFKDDIDESLRAGADDFLSKPFSEKDFIGIIQKHIKKT